MFADDNFKFDENGRKFSKRVENTVCTISPFLTVFLKRIVLQTHKNQGLFGKGLIAFADDHSNFCRISVCPRIGRFRCFQNFLFNSAPTANH